nr:immunoglobulin light chain junction region [Macaca mulatta]MOY07262.1 immunoglobulin light chain junction region [Macaca mulatta]MOY10318.1 immunoglobulin light chain junction region [Macaca mulatta]
DYYCQVWDSGSTFF